MSYRLWYIVVLVYFPGQKQMLKRLSNGLINATLKKLPSRKQLLCGSFCLSPPKWTSALHKTFLVEPSF